MKPERTALYRLYDAQDELLYVGITVQPLDLRMSGHAGAQAWWSEVDHATAIWYPTREDADEAETVAVVAEHPKYNILKRRLRPAAHIPAGEASALTIRCFDPAFPAGRRLPTEILVLADHLRRRAYVDQVISVAERGVPLSVIPRDAEWQTLPINNFLLFEDCGDGGPPFIAVELPHERHYSTSPTAVRMYRKKFELLKREAVHGDEAVTLIRDVARSLQA